MTTALHAEAAARHAKGQCLPSDWETIGYFYEPISYFNGKVLKHAGNAAPMNVDRMMAKPGMVMLPTYMGDRINADDHTPFN